MKQKDKIISSLIIAFVAGFIYYAFADYDVIKKIPQLAYETVKTAIIQTTNEDEPVEKNTEKNLTAINEDNNSYVVNTEPSDNIIVLENGVFAHIPNLANLVRYSDFDEQEILSKIDMRRLERLEDFGFNTKFNNGNIEFASFSPYEREALDSHRVKVRIKLQNLDSLNEYIDESMIKLNETLSKLNEQLKSEEFLKNIPEINRKDIEIDGQDIDVEINTDEIREAIKESMKEFDENMKEFNFDMKEFKDSMKMFKESMKELKKNMKDLDSVKLRHSDKKLEIIES